MSGGDSLLKAARTARENAYAAYSGFAVGAALQTDAGIFAGCNVENISFGLTLCAERAAVATAIANGATEMTMLCIVTDSDRPCVPCGACRQVLAEFNPNLRVVSSTVGGDQQEFVLSKLLPQANQGLLETDV
ncbi:MAG: cytidine deaminase [Verrucomicrobiota bacterium]|jgi:cytidine deaminase